MAALEELMNHSLVDDYDKQRFASVATPVCGQGVVQEGGGWDLWKHVIGYGIVGLGFVVVLVLGAFGKLDPLIDVGDAFLRFARRVRDFFGRRGLGRDDEESYAVPDLGPLPPVVPALPLNRTDSDRLAEVRECQSTSV